MSTFLIAILAFIVAIGILVTFHEFGHFIVARACGVKVLRFSVGFGKSLWSIKDKQGTEYVIAALPLGGYVKMLDEREGPVPADQLSYAFNRKSVWSRFIIVLAGPAFNLLFAIFAYWLMFMIGISGAIPIVGEVKLGSIADKAGIVEKDEIIAVDHHPTRTWAQVAKELMNRLGDKDQLEIETKQPNGQVKSHVLELSNWEFKGSRPDLMHGLGIEPYIPPIPPVILEIMSDEPAEIAGILPGDVITKVDGKPVTQWKDFVNVTTISINQSLNIELKRNEKEITLVLVPRAKENANGEIVGFVGLVVKTEKLPESLQRLERLGPIQALFAATQKTYDYTILSFKIIGKMIVGDIGLRTLSGPITIAQGAGASAVVGIQYYLAFLALISISLGVLNLLPIPVLDGGHLLYYAIEIITRRPVSDKVQMVSFKIGMLLLLFLMTIAFYNDLLRLF